MDMIVLLAIMSIAIPTAAAAPMDACIAASCHLLKRA